LKDAPNLMGKLIVMQFRRLTQPAHQTEASRAVQGI
jgi:hypothetical protein